MRGIATCAMFVAIQGCAVDGRQVKIATTPDEKWRELGGCSGITAKHIFLGGDIT